MEKKIAVINTVNIGSTGNIAVAVSELAREEGYESYICCPKIRANMKRKVQNQLFIGTRIDNILSKIISRLTGLHGCFSFFSTLFFLKKLNRIGVDIIHLHNLHDNYINLSLLFRFIKKKQYSDNMDAA